MLIRSGQFLGYATIAFSERSDPFMAIYMLLWPWFDVILTVLRR